MRRAVAALIAAVISIGLFSFSIPSFAASDPEYGLGGGASFTEESVVQVPAGTTTPPVQYLFVQNTGTARADVTFDGTGSPAVTVNSPTTTFTLEPREAKKVFFSVAVSPGAAPERVKVHVQARQTNIPKKAGITYAPAFGGTFFVDVVGASATAEIVAVNPQDQSPVAGNISIDYRPAQGAPFTVAAKPNASNLSAVLAPGNYQAKIAVPNLFEKTQNFSIAANEKRTITLSIAAVSFLTTAARPIYSGSQLRSAELVADVQNTLRRQERPYEIHAVVRRDGAVIDDVLMGKQPELASGVTGVRINYEPQGGWEAGEYSFEFDLRTDLYTVHAENVPRLSVAAPWWQVAAVIGGGIVVVGLLLIVVWRRSRRPQVPDLQGLTPSEVYRVLAEAGLRMGLESSIASQQEKGTVIRQSPQAGVRRKPGSPVNVVISRGPLVTAANSAVAQAPIGNPETEQ